MNSKDVWTQTTKDDENRPVHKHARLRQLRDRRSEWLDNQLHSETKKQFPNQAELDQLAREYTAFLLDGLAGRHQ